MHIYDIHMYAYSYIDMYMGVCVYMYINNTCQAFFKGIMAMNYICKRSDTAVDLSCIIRSKQAIKFCNGYLN